MTVELVLTEEIIDCFHTCAKKADYRQLFNDHPKFFEMLVENLEKVKLPNSGGYIFFTKNSKHCLDILKQWHSGGISFCQELLDMEKKYPTFIGHLREFGSVRDWDEFYDSTNYKGVADDIFGIARKQEVLDFKIECAGIIFESFEKRDKFLEPNRKLRNELMCQIKDEMKLSGTKHEKDGQQLKNELTQIRKELKLSEEKREKDDRKLRNELMSQIRADLKQSEEKREKDDRKLRNEQMDRFARQAEKIHQVSKTNEILSETIKELRLSEKKREEKSQNLVNEIVYPMRKELELGRAKLDEDGQKLRNEWMDRFESQAQQAENRISETNEKIESMNRKLAHFNSSFNEKFDYLGELFSAMQSGEQTEGLNIQKKLAEIDDKFNEKWAKMTFRADWMDRKTERILTILTFIFIFVYMKFF